jgi:predicted permease
MISIHFGAMDEIRVILNSTLPPFGIIAIGYLFRRFRAMETQSLVDISMWIAIPCLAFYSILEKDLPAAEMAGIGIAAVGVSLASGALAWIAFKIARIQSRGLYLPIMFLNAANLPFPITWYLWGADGKARTVIYYLGVVLLLYTLGTVIACGKAHWRRVALEPVLWACILGFVLKGIGGKPGGVVWRGIEILQGAAIPLVLLVLGMQLQQIRLRSIRIGAYAAAIRLFGGLALGIGFAWILGLDGLSRDVVVLLSSMPCAMVTAVFAARYDCDEDLVAAAVMLSTLGAVVFLPAVIFFL